jgi:hypothetical protein
MKDKAVAGKTKMGKTIGGGESMRDMKEVLRALKGKEVTWCG